MSGQPYFGPPILTKIPYIDPPVFVKKPYFTPPFLTKIAAARRFRIGKRAGDGLWISQGRPYFTPIGAVHRSVGAVHQSVRTVLRCRRYGLSAYATRRIFLLKLIFSKTYKTNLKRTACHFLILTKRKGFLAKAVPRGDRSSWTYRPKGLGGDRERFCQSGRRGLHPPTRNDSDGVLESVRYR